MSEIKRPGWRVDRPFWGLVEDSVYLLDLAREHGEGVLLSSSLARASALSSLLLLEASANTCLDALALDRWVHDEMDRLPIMAKYELFLRLQRPGVSLSRGATPVQHLRELKVLRDAYVHPQHTEVLGWTGEEDKGLSPVSDETSMLHVPVASSNWTAQHAEIIMRAAHSFLRHFFAERCAFKPREVTSLLLSPEQTPDSGSLRAIPLLARQVEPLLKKAGVDLSYLHIVWTGPATK